MSERIVLITGANRGIGLEAARQLAADAPQSLTGKFIRDRREAPW